MIEAVLCCIRSRQEPGVPGYLMSCVMQKHLETLWNQNVVKRCRYMTGQTIYVDGGAQLVF